MSKENEVRFGLWNPKDSSRKWPLSGTVKEKTLTDLSALFGSAERHGDKVRISIFQNNRKEKESQPDYNVVVSIMGEQAAQPQPSAEAIDDSLPF